MSAPFERAVAVSVGVELAREWGNRPANHATPNLLAQAAKGLAKHPGIQCKVLGPAEAPIAVIRGRHRWRILAKAPREERNPQRLAVAQAQIDARHRVLAAELEALQLLDVDVDEAAVVLLEAGLEHAGDAVVDELGRLAVIEGRARIDEAHDVALGQLQLAREPYPFPELRLRRRPPSISQPARSR